MQIGIYTCLPISSVSTSVDKTPEGRSATFRVQGLGCFFQFEKNVFFEPLRGHSPGGFFSTFFDVFDFFLTFFFVSFFVVFFVF